MELLTAAQMRAIEQAAIDSGEVTGLELMERAGRGVVESVFEEWPEMAASPGRAVVLCGPGNNGGDGFVVARLLKDKGWEVEVYFYGDEAKLPPDAAENCRRWREMGNAIAAIENVGEAHLSDGDYHLVVDAVFGTGLRKQMPYEVDDLAAAWITLDYRPTHTRIVSVDTPSGLDSDSGRPIGSTAFEADLTVSFHTPKVGHHLSRGEQYCGRLRTVDIGLRRQAPSDAVMLVEADRMKLLKANHGHKYTHGHALVLAGGSGKGGAARLAARGALRIGAGLVTIAAPTDAIAENAARLDAIMLRPMDDASELAKALEDQRLNAVVLGPGLGVSDNTRRFVATALTGGDRGVVLDADALTSFAEAPEDLFALTRDKRAVLTPHMGEFGRLFPDIREKLEAPAKTGPAYSKVDAARDAAARAGCVILLKGPDTVVADASGRASIVSAQYERACPWLATAGAGDVLAGMIGGLLARGFDAMTAAETAAWLHQEAARKFGPGLIAEDLPEQLPAVFRDLGL